MRFEECLVKIVVAAILACQLQLSCAYVGQAKVPVHDGKCQYNGTEITDTEPLKLESPCEEWSCDAGDGILTITGCGHLGTVDGCQRVEGSGLHPHCCPKIVCPSS